MIAEWSDAEETACVYELWKGGVCQYVGQTTKLRQRLRYHHVAFDLVKMHKADDRRERLDLEKRLIYSLKPRKNVQRAIARAKFTPPRGDDVWGCFCEYVM